MKTALSGVSGFLGSGLAARLLQEGHEVLALSRNDPKGNRTREAVIQAAVGLGIETSELALERLVVRDVDFLSLAQSLDPADFNEIDLFWHVAAEMTYASSKLEASFTQNVSVTCQLYRWLGEHAPLCKRFYYVSTAYTVGMDQSGDEVREELHSGPRLLNVYQASKWGAEMSLSLEAQKSSLPLTVFRPSVIIGAEGSGWNAGKDFGMYSIVRALLEAKRRGARRVNLQLDPEAQNNLIPVNQVIDMAIALSENPSRDAGTEFFHATAHRCFPLRESLRLVSELLDLPVNLGPPQSRIDKAIFARMGHNRVFSVQTWNFSQTELARVLGPRYSPYLLSKATLEGILRPYISKKMAAPRPFPILLAAQTAVASAMAWTSLLGFSISLERPRLGQMLGKKLL